MSHFRPPVTDNNAAYRAACAMADHMKLVGVDGVIPLHHAKINQKVDLIKLAQIAVDNLDYKNTYHFLVISKNRENGFNFKENYRSILVDANLRAISLLKDFGAFSVEISHYDEVTEEFVSTTTLTS